MKKLIIIVLFALLAGACGGSDDDADTGDADDANPAAAAESSDGDDDDDGDDVDGGVPAEVDEAIDGADLPEPLEFVPVQERDCAHDAAELDGAATTDDAGNADIELPPAEKPDVDDEFLVPVDELISTDLIVGTGEEAVAGSTVAMQYVGVLASDGTEFDASWNRDATPFDVTLGQGSVIRGWDEGIVGMKVGGRRVLQIPAALAYGDEPRGDVIAADSDLVFIVDLVAALGAPEPAPPIDADNLGAFGTLGIIDLTVGEGCEAQVGDIVLVNYVGVDAVDGVEFDSSFGREPFSVIVGKSQVIDGWNEGIEGMKVGGERILQIPGALAYNDGDLVFRVHMESLIEAPAAHQVSFDGDGPSETEVTTLVEGEGDGVEPGDIIDTNIVVMLRDSGVILQSSYQQGGPTQLAVQVEDLLPGLEEGVVGTKVGELRQVVIPAEVAYPEEIPPQSGLVEGDSLVFIIEPLRITSG